MLYVEFDRHILDILIPSNITDQSAELKMLDRQVGKNGGCGDAEEKGKVKISVKNAFAINLGIVF